MNQLHTHLCNERMIPCPHCEEELPRSTLSQHFLASCDRYPVLCNHKGIPIFYLTPLSLILSLSSFLFCELSTSIARKRANYVIKIGLNYTPNQLVFVDESACDKRTTYRGQAWAIRGRRAFRKTFFVRGKRFGTLSGFCFVTSL